MKKVKLFIFCCLLIMPIINLAQNNVELLQQLGFYCETEPKNIEWILQNHKKCFTPNSQNEISINGQSNYWLHFKLHNKNLSAQYILFFHHPFAKIESYTLYPDSTCYKQISGYRNKLNDQLIKQGDKNKIVLDTKNGDAEIFIRLTNELRTNYRLNNMQVVSWYDWGLNKTFSHIFHGFFIGVIVMIIVLSLLYKISDVKTINYIYILYLLFLLIYFLNIHEYTALYLFSNNPEADILLIWFIHPASLLYIQFARKVFHFNIYFPKLNNLITYYLFFAIGIISFLLAVLIFDFSYYMYIAGFIEIFHQLIGVAIILTGFRKAGIEGKLITIGAVISSVATIFVYNNLATFQVLTEPFFFYQLGYLIEFMFIAVAINFRYIRIIKEKNKAALEKTILEKENQVKEEENKRLTAEAEINRLNAQFLATEIEEQNRKLALNSMQLVHQEELITNVKLKLKNIVANNQLNAQSLTELVSSLNQNQIKSFWEEFEIYFNQLDNDFIEKLTKITPDLTKAELRLCSLLKLNLSTKEIAEITRKNPKSIEVFRSRLRKKLKIEKSDSLSVFLNQL